MAKDGLLPSVFAAIHPRFKTPHLTTLLTGIVAAVISGLFPIGFLGEMVSIGALLAFTMVSAGVLVMRYTKPDVPRHFRVPWVPLVPLLGMIFSLAQMLALPRDTWIRLVVWMLIGFVIYFIYSRRNSRLRQGLSSSHG
jgi:APA family basic amino acid/polyamine antiporter